jgi:hypothetical protein
VPQPGHPPPDGVASGSGSPPAVNRATRPDAPTTGGMFGQLFSMMGGSGNSSNSSRANRNSHPREERDHEDVPGRWTD